MLNSLNIYLFLIILLLAFSNNANSQEIYGTVKSVKNKPLDAANVYWLNTNTGVYTGIMGDFAISKNPTSNKLVASYIGYLSDTIEVNNQAYIQFNLKPDGTLDEVLIAQAREGVEISSINTIKTENITSTELRKAACCDLAGCFETQATVEARTTNFITNAKELRILGLSGVYNQILIDGFPIIQGASFTYGISGIPGSLVNNIYVSKGANSVLQGFESISGQINVITKKPEDTDKLLLNAYINSFGEKQLNANYAFSKNKVSNLTALHTVQPAAKLDRDKDKFLDLPQLTRYMVYNKTQIGSDRELGFNSTISTRFVHENRLGGQKNFRGNQTISSENPYGQYVEINQPELLIRAGYRLSNTHNFILYTSGQYHMQNSTFGLTHYDAEQFSVYANFVHDFNYGENNNLKTGVSHRYFNLDETIHFVENDLQKTYNGDYKKKENISGVFTENSLNFLDDQLTLITGLRLDYHNQHKLMFTPRIHMKYNITEKADVRASIGYGWRTVNLFSENTNLLASSRDLILDEVEVLKPEKALNLGINFTQKFDTDNISGYVTTDFYRTDFQNQFFPDYDTDPTKAYINNYEGESISNAFQVELNVKTWEVLEWKIGYNYLDVFRKQDGDRIPLPFNAKHRLHSVLGYQPNKSIRFDANMHWYSKRRLPNTNNNPEIYQRSDYSKSYATLSTQVTYNVKRFEIYGGCENIFDFRQKRPIISWENPYSPYFDTASVWGPTKGREFYLGIRYRIKNDTE